MKGKRTGVNTEAEGSRDGDRWERERDEEERAGGEFTWAEMTEWIKMDRKNVNMENSCSV